ILTNTVGVPPGDSPAATADSSASALASGLLAWQAPMRTTKAATAVRLGLTGAFYSRRSTRQRACARFAYFEEQAPAGLAWFNVRRWWSTLPTRRGARKDESRARSR